MYTDNPIAKPHDSGKRLDAFLLEQSSFQEAGLTRSGTTQAIETQAVLVNDKPSKPSYRLKAGDKVSFNISPSEPLTLVPNPDLAINILFENADFLIIDKPAGIQVHPSSADTSGTVANWLIARYPDIASVGENSLRPGIMHRLDKNTSGLMVIAKTQETFTELKRLFAERKVSKTYIAFVHGHVSPEQGTIDTPLARSGSLAKQSVATSDKHVRGFIRSALTQYHVIEHLGNLTLVEAKPKTGRTHQIRVHLASIGHPIVGDPLYTPRNIKRSLQQAFPRHLLHAHKLSFVLFGQDYSFESPLPADFHTSASVVY